MRSGHDFAVAALGVKEQPSTRAQCSCSDGSGASRQSCFSVATSTSPAPSSDLLSAASATGASNGNPAGCLSGSRSAARGQRLAGIFPPATECTDESDARLQLQGVKVQSLQLSRQEGGLRGDDRQIVGSTLYIECHR